MLFVAGSAHDVGGASRAGMDVYWANRGRVPAPTDGKAMREEEDLRGLARTAGGLAIPIGRDAIVLRDDGLPCDPRTDLEWLDWVAAGEHAQLVPQRPADRLARTSTR